MILRWAEEDLDALYWYYVQTREDENVVENIEKLFLHNGVTNKTRSGIIEQLLKHSIISQKCYEEYLSKENINNNITNKEDKDYSDIQAVKEQLVKENMGNSILWLQNVLLEVCHCKMIEENGGHLMEGDIYEPVPYCYISKYSVILFFLETLKKILTPTFLFRNKSIYSNCILEYRR